MDTTLEYKWQQTLMDAFLELKPERLPERVGIAERTITERLHDQLQPEERERAALVDALHILHVMFPD